MKVSDRLRRAQSSRQTDTGKAELRTRFKLVRQTREGEELIGSSAAIRQVVRQIARFARVQVPVCLIGETGVGKNLVAHLIHENSRRRTGPFIKVDCSLISVNLWVSECMGSRKGAYTGATTRGGLFKCADGGTLFIDEVQDLSWEHQAKLRDFLDSRRIRPVGSTRQERVNARLILGMNRNPRQMVNQHQFRSDLFRRLGRNVIAIPPLRQHKEDIAELAEYALEKTCQQNELAGKELSREALALLQAYDWPGNVGELRNMIEAAVLGSDGRIVSAEDLERALHAWDLPGGEPATRVGDKPSWMAKVSRQGLSRVLKEFERELIVPFLDQHDGCVRRAARALGIGPSTLSGKIKKYGLKNREQGQREK